MGWYNYISDIASSLTIQPAYADERANPGPPDTSGEQSSGVDARSGGVGTAQHDRGAAVKGGASPQLQHAGTNEESDSEKEANAADAEKASARSGEAPAGHKPGAEDGKAKAGQLDADTAGPHGGSVKQGMSSTAEDEEAGEDEEGDDGAAEEEEEEDEPEDPKPKIEEECMKTQQCAPLKHHYDECAERVTQQHEQHGKAQEDCVEEYFHMMHCASQCAAPKLFKLLR